MQFSTALMAALATVASAQMVHVVSVGMNGTLTYSPNNIKAAAGDMVQFQFLAGAHTATMSTFDGACQPASVHNASIAGFHSGPQPANASLAMGVVPTYTIMVNSTAPIWVYCATGKHCQAGMSMVINENTAANASRSLANYQASSKTATTINPSTANSTNTGTGSGTGTGTGSTGSTSNTPGSLGIALSAPSTISLLGLAAAMFFL